MRKLVIAAAAVLGVGVVLKIFASKLERVDWETRFANMPDNAPRKWMFRNITEIRDNTERIIELLEPRTTEQAPEPTPEPVAESAAEGPPEIVDAARQEVEYPGDETDEG
jgi:hypothetical protein